MYRQFRRGQNLPPDFDPSRANPEPTIVKSAPRIPPLRPAAPASAAPPPESVAQTPAPQDLAQAIVKALDEPGALSCVAPCDIVPHKSPIPGTELATPTTPPKPRRPRAPCQAPPQPPPDPNESESSRHARKCSVCNHPEREDIDDHILHWIHSTTIAWHYNLNSLSIRRHAYATGLLERRVRNRRYAVDHLIEQACTAHVTGETVLRAIRAASCLDDSGRWIEPPKQVVMTFEHKFAAEIAPAAPAPPATVPGSSSILELASQPATNDVLIEHDND